MPERITIQNYYLDKCKDNPGKEANYIGIDICGIHFVVSKEDYVGYSTFYRSGVIRPRTIYQIIDYNEDDRIATAVEVEKESTIEKVATELYTQLFN